MKIFKIFTMFFAYGFCLSTVAKLQTKQNSDEQLETQKELLKTVDNLATALAQNLKYSLSMIIGPYIVSVLITKDYLAWTNLAYVFFGLFFIGVLSSALNIAMVELAENKDK